MTDESRNVDRPQSLQTTMQSDYRYLGFSLQKQGICFACKINEVIIAIVVVAWMTGPTAIAVPPIDALFQRELALEHRNQCGFCIANRLATLHLQQQPQVCGPPLLLRSHIHLPSNTERSCHANFVLACMFPEDRLAICERLLKLMTF